MHHEAFAPVPGYLDALLMREDSGPEWLELIGWTSLQVAQERVRESRSAEHEVVEKHMQDGAPASRRSITSRRFFATDRKRPRAADMGRPETCSRDAVLRQVVRTFWARGYVATAMRELVEATEVVSKTLYAEFGSKEELFLAAVDAYIADESHRIREHLGRPPLGLST